MAGLVKPETVEPEFTSIRPKRWRRSCFGGYVPDGRSGVTGACRPVDAAWLPEQARTHGLIDTKPLHVAEYRQENDK